MKKGYRTVLFILIEAVLYAVFIVLDQTDGYEFTVAALKYISIHVCVAMALVNAVMTAKTSENGCVNTGPGTAGLKSAVLGAAALCFTAVSDWFLLFADDIRPGVVFFCIVQTIYMIVILGGEIRKTCIVFAARAVSAAVLFLLLKGSFPEEKLLLGTVIFYAVSFIANIAHLVADIILSKKNPHLTEDIDRYENIPHHAEEMNQSIKMAHHPETAAVRTTSASCLFLRPVVFLVGMILFLLCDINVLLYNLGDYVSIDAPLYNSLSAAAPYLIWVFYLPSQVLIVLSNLRRQNDRKN
ncbi:MAG: hypothetical protein K6E62_04155 [Lachnospiraceae bacterium]|nr:hypothetical protein [Lachnospiraceae bacterium]